LVGILTSSSVDLPSSPFGRFWQGPALATTTQIYSPESREEGTMSTAKTVLVVDDEAPIRRTLERILNEWGYLVKEAGSATEALEVMLAQPASIILIDLIMPGHDGFWLMERIREKWPTTPIVVITGADELDTIIKSRREGAIDYVLKPFERGLLRQALNRAEAALGGLPTP
jgi:DNA-binding NtrC family response regulator